MLNLIKFLNTGKGKVNSGLILDMVWHASWKTEHILPDEVNTRLTSL